MVKMAEQFRDSCKKLLSLMYKGKLEPDEEGYHTNGGTKIVSYKDGYKLELHKLTDAIFDFSPTIQKNNSREYIEKKIDNFLFDCFLDLTINKTVKIDSFFRDLIKDLKQSEPFMVPLFIENLSLDDEITIGMVKFLPYSIHNYKKIFRDAGVTDDGIDLLDSTYNTPYMQRVRSIGIVIVFAREDKKAIEKAEELIDQALDIIRFIYISNDFGILGKYKSPQRNETFTIKLNTSLFSCEAGVSGDIIGCKFTRELYDKLWTDYLSNLDAVLKRPESQRESMEKKLLIVFTWFREILKNRDEKENIVRIFSTLETLLISNRNDEKIDNVSERIAFINYPDRENRLFVYKLVKEMYKHRNELIHEGETEFKELDYNTLFIQLRICIATITKQLNKYPKLEQWIELIELVKNEKFDKKLSFQ